MGRAADPQTPFSLICRSHPAPLEKKHSGIASIFCRPALSNTPVLSQRQLGLGPSSGRITDTAPTNKSARDLNFGFGGSSLISNRRHAAFTVARRRIGSAGERRAACDCGLDGTSAPVAWKAGTTSGDGKVNCGRSEWLVTKAH